MYDYNNGRFLSVDPFISNPSSTQALNPYTYIFNNLLSGVDPTGYRPDLPTNGLDRETRQAFNEATSDFVDDAVEVLDKIDTASDFINPLKGLSKKAIKTGFKFLKNKVKKLFRNPKKALSNGNKNKSINTKSSSSKNISDTGSQKTIPKKETPHEKGQRLVDKRKAESPARGEKVLGEEVTIKMENGKKTRADLLVKTREGNIKCVECKNGPSAKLTPNQKQAQKELPSKGGEMRGKKAEQAGFKSGEKVEKIEFEVDKRDI